MTFKPIRIVLIFGLLLLAVSLLGGSAIWSVLGLADDLTIEGDAQIVRADSGGLGEGWTSYGGDGGGNRYVAATQIDADNVDQLGIAWTHRSGALKGKSDKDLAKSALQTTPILVEDSLVFCTQFNEVIAVDPGTGEEKWGYDPVVPIGSNPANQYTCRGVSYWKDDAAEPEANCATRLFTGTVDARIIALAG
ncbi:hypothetical protein [Parasphingorhabdus sp.]|uniref:hypothetical protein n=1 Tax=Parasphingorhabdus sp. TaxID=2709688 RepID=UPI00326628BA